MSQANAAVAKASTSEVKLTVYVQGQASTPGVTIISERSEPSLQDRFDNSLT